MLYFKNLKPFIKSKRLAIKSCYFLSILLLVFISAIIMVSDDTPQNTSCTNSINASTDIRTLKPFNSEENLSIPSENEDALKTSTYITN